MILKLGMKHQAMELYKVFINNDPGMTLTHLMARSTYVAYPRSQVSVYRTIGPLVHMTYSPERHFCLTEVSFYLMCQTVIP